MDQIKNIKEKVILKIDIDKDMVQFRLPVKTFTLKYLGRIISVDTKINIVHKTSLFITPVLANMVKSNNTTRSTYINKNINNIYQGLI